MPQGWPRLAQRTEKKCPSQVECSPSLERRYTNQSNDEQPDIHSKEGADTKLLLDAHTSFPEDYYRDRENCENKQTQISLQLFVTYS